MAPVCSNCSGTDVVWSNELKTGMTGGGTLSLRARGEIPLGTRICRTCGHADLFLRDISILHQPHNWRAGEFIPIVSKPVAKPAGHHAGTGHVAPTVPATPAPIATPAPPPAAPSAAPPPPPPPPMAPAPDPEPIAPAPMASEPDPAPPPMADPAPVADAPSAAKSKAPAKRKGAKSRS